MSRRALYWGNVPVPYATLWSAEEGMHVAACQYANGLTALCQASRRGQGKPVFGKPHMVRQREVISLSLCDLCARPLRNTTRVSLSHARVQPHGAEGPAVLQVEPMLHRQCAAISMQHCPSLRRDIAAGTLHIRQVLRSRAQLAIMTPEAVEEFTGTPRSGVIGHAKIELLEWRDRELEWLGSPAVQPDIHQPAAREEVANGCWEKEGGDCG
ncbi:MAG: hypothetical protein PHU07_02160 [Acidocella sp.]|nr:hypothetical protein [Acidocella sp.]